MFTFILTPFFLAGLCHPNLVPVVGIWASRTVQYLALILHRALLLVTYSPFPTSSHPAITNTNRYSKVRVCIMQCSGHALNEGVPCLEYLSLFPSLCVYVVTVYNLYDSECELDFFSLMAHWQIQLCTFFNDLVSGQ